MTRYSPGVPRQIPELRRRRFPISSTDSPYWEYWDEDKGKYTKKIPANKGWQDPVGGPTGLSNIPPEEGNAVIPDSRLGTGAGRPINPDYGVDAFQRDKDRAAIEAKLKEEKKNTNPGNTAEIKITIPNEESKPTPKSIPTDVKWTDRQGRALTGARANRGVEANFRIKNPKYTSIDERRRLKDEAKSNTAIQEVSTESTKPKPKETKPADNQASSKGAGAPSGFDVASQALSFVQNLLEGKKGGQVLMPTNRSMTIADDWRQKNWRA